MLIDWNSIKHFKKHEFADDKGECWASQELVMRIDTAREISGIPYKITSACRNPEQNKRVGGSDTSSHLEGLAVDLSATNSVERFKILFGLIKSGFNRIGIAKDFIHADVDYSKPAGVIWLY